MTSHEWGRVDDDGTVYVRTADGERAVGQYPEGTPEEALRFFTERYDALAFEVDLLEQRIKSGVLSPEEADRVGQDGARPGRRAPTPSATSRRSSPGSTRWPRSSTTQREAPQGRAGAARPPSPGRARRRSSPRPRSSPRAPTGATAPTGCASCSTSGRRSPASTGPPTTRCGAGSRPRARRTPGAARRTSPSSTRSATPPGSSRSGWPTEAEALADSTDWGPTAGRYRDLMRQWKAAGPAPRDVDEALWKRFRGAQDAFFGARDAANAEQDQEFAANAEVKEKLLVEAEALLPVTDLEAAKRAFRDIAERWDAAGKVPARADEGPRGPDPQGRAGHPRRRGRAVARSDPEKSARADDMVAKLEAAIADVEADLEKARAAGNEKKVKELEENLASRQSFLGDGEAGQRRVLGLTCSARGSVQGTGLLQRLERAPAGPLRVGRRKNDAGDRARRSPPISASTTCWKFGAPAGATTPGPVARLIDRAGASFGSAVFQRRSQTGAGEGTEDVAGVEVAQGRASEPGTIRRGRWSRTGRTARQRRPCAPARPGRGRCPCSEPAAPETPRVGESVRSVTEAGARGAG